MIFLLAEHATTFFNHAAQNLSGPFTSILEQLIRPARQSVRDNFNIESDPERRRWLPRKRQGDGHPLLQDKGPMYQAAVGDGPGAIARIENDTLSIGVSLDVVVYARRHNLGDVPGSRDSLGRPANMPKREYLGMTEERAREGDKIVGDSAETLIFGKA